jgi:hypothetical protein
LPPQAAASKNQKVFSVAAAACVPRQCAAV